MSEPWLREKEGAWIPSPQVQGVYIITVNELLHPNMKRWNKEKIESLFPMHIANSILDVPLHDMFEEDKLVWFDDLHGQYSVKSGYNLMLNCTGAVEGLTSHSDWKTLWKIQAPPKAKHLLWRICKGCLPTRIRLQERRVPCLLSCSLCDLSNEDDWHILFECNDSVQARQTAGLDHVIAPRLQQDLNKTSLGWCLRDHLGNFVMAGTGWREGNYSIVEGEALALFEALKVMEQKGLSHVLVETDSKSVVNAIQHLRDGHSQFSVLIRSIKNVLLLHPNFKVSFIKRQANMVAHTLARAATSWSSRCIFETLPSCIASILSNEMS
ncbi:unnamed protein product [Trifolium pratense]|uniref:Uncharacterized protein n=1 Tax=Trifolium pratense TaxID=57577 RepID=A0ACB0JI24_TRIPR|nr:unnamed protein product [Trifolium pratense]